jgi:hypothetical protein
MGGPSRYKRRMRRRFAAWLVCGPLGHLWAGALDWAVLFVRWRRAQLRAGRSSSER